MGSAPRSSSRATTAGVLLYPAALCNGVSPYLFRAMRSAPRSSRAWTAAGVASTIHFASSNDWAWAVAESRRQAAKMKGRVFIFAGPSVRSTSAGPAAPASTIPRPRTATCSSPLYSIFIHLWDSRTYRNPVLIIRPVCQTCRAIIGFPRPVIGLAAGPGCGSSGAESYFQNKTGRADFLPCRAMGWVEIVRYRATEAVVFGEAGPKWPLGTDWAKTANRILLGGPVSGTPSRGLDQARSGPVCRRPGHPPP